MEECRGSGQRKRGSGGGRERKSATVSANGHTPGVYVFRLPSIVSASFTLTEGKWCYCGSLAKGPP